MKEAARDAVADALDDLASQQSWNSAVWQKCFNLVTADWDDELVAFVRHELIHYDDVSHPRSILGFKVKPDLHRLQDYREEFRAVAAALRAHMPLIEAKKQFCLRHQ